MQRPPFRPVAAPPARIAAALLLAAAGPLGAQGSVQPWQIVPQPQASLVYARDGALIGEIGRASRTSVPLRTLPRYVAQAFIAVEDQRFYQHDGVDLIGVAGAIKGKLLEGITGDHRGGASTITQQLIGNMHPELIDRRDMSPARKIREQLAAREMEKRYTKDQILEAYLNQINFGHGWHGIESAARHYFGKTAARLTLAEAAVLAALPKSPVGYDPTRFPERAKQRRDLILSLMAAQRMISESESLRARAVPIVTAPNAGMAAPSGYFVEAARQAAERAGINVMAGGYRIFTTADPALQRAAVGALVSGTARVEARPGYRHAKYDPAKPMDNVLQGAVVAIDPFTGDVRALVGGRNYALAPFNRAVLALRQPGSSFKPFVYARALEDTLSAASVVPDTALAIPLDNGRVYSPGNADGQFMGAITLRDAIVHSRNPVAVQLAMAMGADTLAAQGPRFGLDTRVAAVPSSALGASAVHPLDYVAAYAVWANGGMAVEPRIVTRIEDAQGRVVFQRGPGTPQPVVDPRVAFIVRDMLREAAERGTGAPARRAVPAAVPVAGKTGTTNDNVDVWFMGMTPDLVAGVWLGFDRPRTITPGAAGGTLAAPIWGDMMARWYAGRPAPAPWTPPVGLVTMELDRLTGQPADAATPPERRYVEYFVPGTEPGAVRVPWGRGGFGGVVP